MEKIREFYALRTNAGEKRCRWAVGDVLTAYHDNDYGVIRMENEAIYEQMCLELLCAGRISQSVIGKRDALREVFRGYDLKAVVALSDEYLSEQAHELALPAAKLLAVKANALCAMQVIVDFGSLFKFVYKYKQPDRFLFALRQYGFTQVGPATATSLMKNLGMIDAHEPGCFKRKAAAVEE